MSDTIRVNNDVKIVTRYAMGLTPTEEPQSFITPSTIPLSIGLEQAGREAVSIFSDKKAYSATQKAIKEMAQSGSFRETLQNFNRLKELKDIEQRLMNIEIDKLKLSGCPEAQIKAAIDCRKSEFTNNIGKMFSETKNLNEKDYVAKIKEFEKLIAERNLDLTKLRGAASTKSTSFLGKVWNGIKTKSSQTVAEGMAQSSKLRATSKFIRNNALLAVGVDLLFGSYDIYKTKETFDKLDEDGNYVENQYDESGNLLVRGSGKESVGTQKALKQTGRIAATTGAQVAAYALGAKAGGMAVAALWAAKGAAAGSIAPGIGTLVGAVVGFGVGIAASYFTGKIMEKALGKSELDQLQDKLYNEPAEQMALRVQANDADLQEVTNIAVARMQATGDNNSEVAEALENIQEAYKNNEIGTNSPVGKAYAAQNQPETPSSQPQVGTPTATTQTPTATTQTPAATTQTPTTTTQTPTVTTQASGSANPTGTASGNGSTAESTKYDKILNELDYYIKSMQNITNPSYSPYNFGFMTMPNMNNYFMNNYFMNNNQMYI